MDHSNHCDTQHPGPSRPQDLGPKAETCTWHTSACLPRCSKCSYGQCPSHASAHHSTSTTPEGQVPEHFCTTLHMLDTNHSNSHSNPKKKPSVCTLPRQYQCHALGDQSTLHEMTTWTTHSDIQ